MSDPRSEFATALEAALPMVKAMPEVHHNKTPLAVQE